MDMDTPEAAPAAAPSAPPAPAAAPRRRGSPLALILALLALGGGAYAVWRGTELEQKSAEAAASASAVRAELEALNRRIDQSNRERDLLRQRLDDLTGVNKSLREELLGVTERARVLEDAVANLAEKRLSGHDGLLLDEADMLLRLGEERYTLFGNAREAAQAYRLADDALANVDDPAFATVRETLAVELKALGEQRELGGNAAIVELERLRGAVQQLPLAPERRADAPPPESRLAQILGRFVRIRHDEAAAPTDRGLARTLATLDLRAAEAALLARDTASFRAAVQRARTQLQATFDATATAEVVAALDRLGASEAPPAPTVLGAALKELRNLRSTHRLRQQGRGDAAAGAGAP